MAEKKTEEAESEKTGGVENTSALEWLVAALGAILVAGSIGFLLYSAISQTGKPPILIVNKKSVTPVEGGFLVKYSLENKGEENAGAVTIEGKLTDGEKEIETSTATVSYAPSNSTREGGMFFTKNPESFKLELRATGYENP